MWSIGTEYKQFTKPGELRRDRVLTYMSPALLTIIFDNFALGSFHLFQSDYTVNLFPPS